MTYVRGVTLNEAVGTRSTVSVALPAGSAAGDPAFVFVANNAGTTVTLTKTGWVQVVGSAANNMYIYGLTGKISSADITAGSVTFTVSGGLFPVWLAVLDGTQIMGIDAAVTLPVTPGVRPSTPSSGVVTAPAATPTAHSVAVTFGFERTATTGTTLTSQTFGTVEYGPVEANGNSNLSSLTILTSDAPASTSTGANTLTYRDTSGNALAFILPAALVAAPTPATGAAAVTFTATGVTGASPTSAAASFTVVAAGTATAPPAITTSWLSRMDTTTARAGLVAVNATTATLLASTSPTMSSPISGSGATPNSHGWCSDKVTGLTPGTVYYFAWQLNGVTQAVSHTATTLQTGPLSYVAITGSCQNTGSNHAVFDQMVADNPVFFAHQGDIHYADTSDEATWRAAFLSSMTAPKFAALLAKGWMSYVYDNHDWDGQSADPTLWPDSPAPSTFVRELSGDYPAATTNAIYHTWVHGRVRWIKLDQWTDRDAPGNADGPTHQMMSPEQESWLYDTLTNATEPLIILLTSWPLYHNVPSGRWASYPSQTARLRAWITARPAILARLIGIGGDSHVVMADTGVNQDALGVFPTLNASPFNKEGSTFGTWNIANYDPPDTDGVYSRVTITDTGGQVGFKWEAVDQGNVVRGTWSQSFSAVAATASVSFTASGQTQAPVTATGAVQFTAAGTTRGNDTGTANLTFTATTGTLNTATVGTSSFQFTATGAASPPGGGNAQLTFTASATARAGVSGAAFVAFTASGAVGTSVAVTSPGPVYPTPWIPPVVWTFATGPWGQLPNTELPNITGRSVTWRLVGNSEASFTIDGRLPETASIQELISDVRVYRNGVPLLRGRVGPSSDTVSADQHSVAFSVADYRALLQRQVLYDSDTLTYTSTTDAAIVASVISTVQARANGNLGISVVINGTPNTLSSTVFPAGQSVGDAITQLASGSPGFDWDITPTLGSTGLTLTLYYPQRGVDQRKVIDYPGRIQSFTRAADPGAFANTVRASGGTPSTGTAPAPVIASATGIGTDPAGRWDTQVGDTNLLTSGSVTSWAQRMLAASQIVQPAWVVTLSPDDWAGPGDMWLGDPITLSVQSGRLNVVESLRIFEIGMQLDDNSDAATVSLTLGAVNPDRRWRTRTINKRLTALERR